MSTRFLSGLALAGIVCLVATGCSNTADAGNPSPGPKSVDQQVKEIQDNPHMPTDAKERAIATLKGGQTMTKGAQDSNAQKK